MDILERSRDDPRSKVTPVSDAIYSIVLDENKSSFKLADVTNFDWDEFYRFEGYTSNEYICGVLDTTTNNCIDKVIRSADGEGITKIFFLKNRVIVHHELHPRYQGEFVDFLYPVSPERASFRISQQGKTASLNSDGEEESSALLWYKLLPHGIVESALVDLFEENNEEILNMKSITNFEWDTLSLHDGSTSTTSLCNLYSLSDKECESAIPYEVNYYDSSVDRSYLLFSLNSEVVYAELFHHDLGIAIENDSAFMP